MWNGRCSVSFEISLLCNVLLRSEGIPDCHAIRFAYGLVQDSRPSVQRVQLFIPTIPNDKHSALPDPTADE